MSTLPPLELRRLLHQLARRQADPACVCRHCGTRLITRTRRLCRACFDTPEVRDLYPPMGTNASGRRGVGLENRSKHPLPAPTDALPGSAAKVEVLAQRAARGEQLFHPLDVTDDRDRRDMVPIVLRTDCHWRR